MKIIQLTTRELKRKVYINVEHIGHILLSDDGRHTRVGVTTHYNGGFSVVETPEEIIAKCLN
jgi:hypothetical protein